jgi:NitT/TauT family transport system permease protein
MNPGRGEAISPVEAPAPKPGSDYDSGNTTMDGGGDQKPSEARKKQRSRWWARRYRLVLGTAGIVSALGTWEAFGRSGLVDPMFVSAPTKALAALWDMAVDGTLVQHLAVSGHEFVVGFGLALVIGIPFGMIVGYYSKIEAFFDPLINFLYATPRVALLPLLILWFGLGVESKMALIFLSAFFSLVISTATGVREVDQTLITAARSFGANDLAIFRTIVLPGTVPNMVTGIRLGLGHALIAVVVGEFYSATAGIGYVISMASNNFRTDQVFAGIFVIAGAGVIITAVMSRIERLFQSWKPERLH